LTAKVHKKAIFYVPLQHKNDQHFKHLQTILTDITDSY